MTISYLGLILSLNIGFISNTNIETIETSSTSEISSAETEILLIRCVAVAKEYKNKAEACSLINSKPTLVESEGSNFWITILLVVLASSVGLTIGTIVF